LLSKDVFKVYIPGEGLTAKQRQYLQSKVWGSDTGVLSVLYVKFFLIISVL